MIKQLLENGNNLSSMRFNLILAAFGAFILMLAASTYIVVAAFSSAIPEPQWSAIGVFAIGLAGILTGTGFAKAKQKEIEVNEK